MKDFALITGETVKKGDTGGLVESEDCLSQEGGCWVKDSTIVYGRVIDDTVVKNHAHVGKYAVIAEKAIVQSHQNINFGTVTTDLLGTKDWTGALLAEFGIVPKDDKITVYTKALKTYDPNVFLSFDELCNQKTFEIDKEVVDDNANCDVKSYNGIGLYFTIFEIANSTIRLDGNIVLKCEVELNDILTVQDQIIRARKCKVLSAI